MLSKEEIKNLLEKIDNLNVNTSILKTENVLNRFKKIIVSISGGSDSDIVLDLVEKTRKDQEIEYVWFNTGLEYQATRKHLKYLEKKYNIRIKEVRAIKSIPLCCHTYGQPFLSKYVSEKIETLQRYNFKWEDRPFEELAKKYPKCISAIKWWCNYYKTKSGSKTMFNINRNTLLKEFLIENPPKFKISKKCCKYAKKDVLKAYIKDKDFGLDIVGIRKSEGGIRTFAYQNCFSDNHDKDIISQYRPIFWYKDEDKKYYEEMFDIVHSDCYTKYGFLRTGCVGCPYNRKVFEDLEVTKIYEPNLYKACSKIFKDSYEYTKKYREFCKKMKAKEKSLKKQNLNQISFNNF